MKKTIIIVIMLALTTSHILFMNTKSNAAEGKWITVKHKLGTVKVPLNPRKVVVFSYDLLEIMDQKGIPVASVVKTHLPVSLKKYNRDEIVNAGSLFEPDYEALFELQPDIIFISTRQASAYKELSKIAPVVFTFVDSSEYFDSLEKNWTLIGDIYSLNADMIRTVSSIKSRGALLKAVAGKQTALFLMVNDGSLSVFGKGSRFGFIHDDFGFIPADNKIAVSHHGQSVSFEYLAEKNPDVLLVLDRGQAITGKLTADSVLDNDIVKGISAARKNQVIFVDAQAWYLTIGGTVSAEKILSDLQRIIK